MADPDPMTCDPGSRVYDPDPGTVIPDPIYLVTTLASYQNWFNTKATIVFCVVVFINLCLFSNIIDTVFGSYQEY